MKKELLLPILGLVAFVLLLGTGWFLDYRAYSGMKEEKQQLEKENQDAEARIGRLSGEIRKLEASRADILADRMVSNAGDDLESETLRRFYQIEKESGVYLMAGSVKPRSGIGARGPAAAAKPYQESQWTLRVAADYLGLARMIDGLENEADRPAQFGGGRLFEIRGIKTDENPIEGRPGWRYFDLDVAAFQLPAKSAAPPAAAAVKK